MSVRGKTITLTVSQNRTKAAKTIPLYQWDYGQKLLIEGVELPEYYEVHFSNQQYGESVTQLGDSSGVGIPDSLVETGENIYLWLYLHDGLHDGETEYMGVIPVIKRAQPTDITPTPEEEDMITEVIAALNALESDMSSQVTAAETARTAAESAQTGAESAQIGAENAQSAAETAQVAAETAAANAGTAQTAAEAAQTAAEAAYANADGARTSAESAKEYAEAAATTADDAKDSASSSATTALNAKISAEAAQTAAETAQGKAEDAQTAAETAQDTAEAKALVSEGYAVGTQDGVAVESGSAYYHNNAAYYADQAGDAQTAAETAQGLAEAAQTAAETAASHYPVIDETSHNWMVWDETESDYVDTEVLAQGQDGYTPVRGTDYWTISDKAEIVSDVESAIIDDTAGEGETSKTWSADKLDTELTDVKTAIHQMQPAATNADIGKALIVKTVEDGKPTSYEYGSDGGGANIDDNAGIGATTKVWSADKLGKEFNPVTSIFTTGQESGYYRVTLNGEVEEIEGAFTRSKIEIQPWMGKYIEFSVNGLVGNSYAIYCGIADADNKIIARNAYVISSQKLEIPENAKYIYMSFYGSAYNSDYVIKPSKVIKTNDLKTLGVENPFIGLQGVAFGTSITYRAIDYWGYLQYLPGLCGATIENKGLSSSTIMAGMLTTVKNYADYSDKAFAILEGFVNDWYLNNPLGTWKDTTETTVCGCVRSAINYMLSQNSNLTIFIVLDPYGRLYGGLHCESTAENGSNLTQYEFYEEIAKVAESLGIPVIKEYAESQISQNTEQYIYDNIHPNDLGARQSANVIWQGMKRYGMRVG